MASDSLPVPLKSLDPAAGQGAAPTGGTPGARLRRRLQANSRLHWGLLLLNVAGGLIFYLTFLVDGALRPSYDALAQPVSALSLGPGGWVQAANFVLFGIVGCLASFAWGATLSGGLGQIWVPRLQFVAGAAMIVTGLFSQDPANGYPVAAAAPVHPSVQAQIHLLASYVSFLGTVAVLVVMARRLAREPGWRWWATASIAATVWMVACLATFGALIAQHGPGGVFEKLATVPATLLGFAVTGRLLASRDARLARRRPA